MSKIDNKKELILKLRKEVYPGVDDHLIEEVISICERCGVSPFEKTLIIMPDLTGRPAVFATMEHNRAVARNHPDYIRMGDREYGPPIEEQMGSVKMIYPEWARRAVYRYHPNRKDVEVMHVETVRWKDGYSKQKDRQTPKIQWINYPYPMCATSSERRGLKLAFWELLGDLRDDEERDFYTVIESKGSPPPSRAPYYSERHKQDEHTPALSDGQQIINMCKEELDDLSDKVIIQMEKENSEESIKIKNNIIDFQNAKSPVQSNEKTEPLMSEEVELNDIWLNEKRWISLKEFGNFFENKVDSIEEIYGLKQLEDFISSNKMSIDKFKIHEKTKAHIIGQKLTSKKEMIKKLEDN